MEVIPATVERILDLAIKIQQIPSPTGEEKPRAEFIFNYFKTLGAKEVSFDEGGNVYARIIGRGVKPPIVVSAHLDTVFPNGTDLTCARTDDRIAGPGIGDNSLGLASLFGLYWQFSEGMDAAGKTARPAGDVWLVANVGEEGLGDLKGIKAVVERFGNRPLAYVIVEGMSLGQIYNRGLGVRRYRIRVNTRGGHSWTDYGRPSAIHEIAELVVKIKNLPVTVEPRSSLNVGVISGGTSVNTIAAEASLELDLRSESPRQLSHMAGMVEAQVRQANEKGEGAFQVTVEVIGDRPAGEIAETHTLVQTAIACFARAGINVKLNIGSTDAKIPLSKSYPAICVGLTEGGGSHTLGEYIETKPFSEGFSILVDLVQSIFGIEVPSH